MTGNKKKKKSTVKSRGKGRGLKRWSALGFWGRLWRLIWVTALTLWLLSIVLVVLYRFVNPPLTPLMVQRWWEQAVQDGRPVRFERDYVSINDISPNLVTAVVYSEDGLFMYHHGFDVKQLKAAYRENKSGKRFRGGSTISNQTAKNAFLPHSRTMLRKVVESYYTVLIEALWSKERIMEVYLNIIEFGDGIYGCEAASQHYFGHSAAKLSRTEAAQLAATLPAPLLRNPSHQTPYYKRRVGDIKSRFRWGAVDLYMPKEKRKEKYQDRETLWDFFWWRMKNK
jgi:monofunctional biosynthetic peptidoglycan transglycosylase